MSAHSESIPRTDETSLGLSTANVVSIVGQVKRGLPFSRLTRFQKVSQLPLDGITRVMDLPARTLARRKTGGRLTSAESERLLRLSLIYDQAVALFEGDAALARQWLQSPSKALGNQSPLTFTETEPGAREVEHLIGRLEHGVFT